MKNIQDKLAVIQQKLKAPKSQNNTFGGYKYRNCEDILEALKPLLGECCLTVCDDIQLIGDRVYVKATATIALADESLSVSAYAREALTKKGMDESQITGAASSYARKYALNGLFLIDDTKDADSANNSEVHTVSQEQVEQLNNAILVAGVDVKTVTSGYKIKSLSELPENLFENVISRLKVTAQEKAA
jgi:hypothetical protein